MAIGWGSTSSKVPDGYPSHSLDHATDRIRAAASKQRHILLSQGETRPGVVQGQHFGRPLPPSESPYAPVLEWIDPPPRPTPAMRADPRLSNPVTR